MKVAQHNRDFSAGNDQNGENKRQESEHVVESVLRRQGVCVRERGSERVRGVCVRASE